MYSYYVWLNKNPGKLYIPFTLLLKGWGLYSLHRTDHDSSLIEELPIIEAGRWLLWSLNNEDANNKMNFAVVYIYWMHLSASELVQAKFANANPNFQIKEN